MGLFLLWVGISGFNGDLHWQKSQSQLTAHTCPQAEVGAHDCSQRGLVELREVIEGGGAYIKSFLGVQGFWLIRQGLEVFQELEGLVEAFDAL